MRKRRWGGCSVLVCDRGNRGVFNVLGEKSIRLQPLRREIQKRADFLLGCRFAETDFRRKTLKEKMSYHAYLLSYMKSEIFKIR